MARHRHGGHSDAAFSPGSFRDRRRFLRRQFLQDGDLPFTDVLTEEVIAEALAAVGGWLDRIFSPLVTLWVFLGQVLSADHSCRAAVDHDAAHRHGRHESGRTVIYDPVGLPIGRTWPRWSWSGGSGRWAGRNQYRPRLPHRPRRHGGRVGRADPAALGIETVCIGFSTWPSGRTRAVPDLNAGANLALLRRVAVSLKRAKAKGSIQTRRLMAAWDDEFLATHTSRNPCGS